MRVLFLLILFAGHSASAQFQRFPPVTAIKKGELNPLSPDPVFNYHWSDPKATDDLESYVLKPRNWTACGSKAVDMSGFRQHQTILVNGKADICFDFGQVNAGWLEFDSPDFNGEVEMSISEYNRPPEYALGYPTKTLTPKKYGNTYRLELNPELYEGVRFGWIHVRSLSSPWRITAVRLVCQTRPVNYSGSFSCSDTTLTRIWYTGAYTVKLNLLKDYLGAILMNRGDRFSWTGDAYPAQAASMVAFANYDFIKTNLAHTSTQSNGIRSYALYWVLSLIDYYQYTGDAETLRTYIDNVCAKLDDAYQVFGSNPNLLFYGWDERLGAGFEHPNIAEPQQAYKMLSIRAWREFAAVAAHCGRADLSKKYGGYAREKIILLQKDTAWFQHFGLHAGADAITTGLLNAAEQKAIYEKNFRDKVNRISYSPFNQYFVIQAFAALKKYDDALSSIRDLWGGQLRYGATTFFEDYRPSWNEVLGHNAPVPANQCGFTSLCHPWGAGVTKWLSEEVLGIKPVLPGFARFDILPNPGSTLTYVSGKTHTPLGDITASFNILSGMGIFSSPAGSIGRIGIPKLEKNIVAIKVNGVLVWDGKYHPAKGLAGAGQDDRFVYLTGVQPGTYRVKVVYSGPAPVYQEAVEHYPAKYAGIDTVTHGSWGGVYGSDGYVLCNYLGDGRDKMALPSYVKSVEYFKIHGNGLPLNTVWEARTEDNRALAPDAGNGFPRTAACLYAMNADQIGYTFTSTINLRSKHDYKVSLYFLDWDRNSRKIAVEMFDAETSNLIAPMKVVEDCKGGAYLTFVYNKSAKFRINRLGGSNAVLSGIFFDPDK